MRGGTYRDLADRGGLRAALQAFQARRIGKPDWRQRASACRDRCGRRGHGARDGRAAFAA